MPIHVALPDTVLGDIITDNGNWVPPTVILQGITGNFGATGAQGIAGYQGATGIQGIGSQGSTGIQGDAGFQGVTGVQGTAGSQGVTGLSLAGATGVQGSQGVTGVRGLTGLSLEGATGVQGSTGLRGASVAGGLVSITSQVSITNTNTETTILTTTVSTGSLNTGTIFRFRFQGTHQSQATSGSLTFRIYVGATAGQTIQLASQTSARSATFSELEGFATIRSIGAGGTYITTGSYIIYSSSTAVIQAFQGGATTTVVDTTQSNPTIRITAQWATASTTNSLLIQNASIELVKT